MGGEDRPYGLLNGHGVETKVLGVSREPPLCSAISTAAGGLTRACRAFALSLARLARSRLSFSGGRRVLAGPLIFVGLSGLQVIENTRARRAERQRRTSQVLDTFGESSSVNLSQAQCGVETAEERALPQLTRHESTRCLAPAHLPSHSRQTFGNQLR